ncbi:MAG: hypothetical protein V7K32_12805 [Nostoc sp.]
MPNRQAGRVNYGFSLTHQVTLGIVHGKYKQSILNAQCPILNAQC